MIVLISCVKKKKNGLHQAKDLYDSTLFKYSLDYARKLTTDDNIYILSAKYGLLELNQEIYKYELTLNNMNEREKKIWAFKVYNQMINKGIKENEKIIFLCGMNYRRYLEKKFKNSDCPIKGLPIGKILSFYKKKREC